MWRLQHADALLEDLGRDRAAFWRTQLDVVDALLADASDKVAHRVKVKLAQARANFERQYGQQPAEILQIVHRMANVQPLNNNQARTECPACESTGVATGRHDVEWDHEPDEEGNLFGTEWFVAGRFACSACDLQLDSAAELTAARIQSRWEIGDADARNYLAYLEPDSYEDEARREERLEEK